MIDNFITRCVINDLSIFHTVVLYLISLAYYIFTLQLYLLSKTKDSIWSSKKIKPFLFILGLVFIFCGNSKWLGCSGNIYNDSVLCILQYIMIIAITIGFKSISNLKSQKQIDLIIKHKDDEFNLLIETVFKNEETKSWFFDNTESLNGAVNDKGYFILLSKNWSKVLGYSLDELYKIPFINLVHPDDRDKTLNIYNNENKNENYFINRYITKDKKVIYLKWSPSVKYIHNSYLFSATLLK